MRRESPWSGLQNPSSFRRESQRFDDQIRRPFDAFACRIVEQAKRDCEWEKQGICVKSWGTATKDEERRGSHGLTWLECPFAKFCNVILCIYIYILQFFFSVLRSLCSWYPTTANDKMQVELNKALQKDKWWPNFEKMHLCRIGKNWEDRESSKITSNLRIGGPIDFGHRRSSSRCLSCRTSSKNVMSWMRSDITSHHPPCQACWILLDSECDSSTLKWGSHSGNDEYTQERQHLDELRRGNGDIQKQRGWAVRTVKQQNIASCSKRGLFSTLHLDRMDAEIYDLL